MKIIKPSFEVLERDEQRGGLAIIEKAARTCYKTEDAIRDGSAERMVRMLIQRRHEAMLEHGDYIFTFEDPRQFDNVVHALRRLMEDTGIVPLLTFTNIDQRRIISGNIRAWREFIATRSASAYYFTGAIDPVYIEDLISPEDRCFDRRIRSIHYSDLYGKMERSAHLRQTVRFTIDRGVSHEFVRHRVMSFAQESTRYCNYSDDRFGKEITVIEPCYLLPESEPYGIWKRQCMSAEVAYFAELHQGLQAQEARAVLPTCTKTELVMTGTLRQWNHFFDMRARQTTGKAHPQAAEVAVKLMQEMAKRFPDVIDGDTP